MIHVALRDGADLDGFRAAVRRLAAANARPEEVIFASGSLFSAAPETDAPAVMLSRAMTDLVRLVICHSDPERYALLYGAIWRTLHGDRHLLEVASDPLVHRLQRLAKSVRRDLHKMHAFVRFRRVETPDGERFVAWFEPEHFILEATADFFVTRFRSMDWTILTPIGRLHWDRQRLTVGPPAHRDEAPADDPFEAGWRGYYESTFNPARVNLTATRAEMPKSTGRISPRPPRSPKWCDPPPRAFRR